VALDAVQEALQAGQPAPLPLLAQVQLRDVLEGDARQVRQGGLSQRLQAGAPASDPEQAQSLGAGLVVASQPAAGRDLLAFRHASFPGDAVVPAANASALQFLSAHGAAETSRSPRMALGDELAWRPEWVSA
jgi:hypothetical protein